MVARQALLLTSCFRFTRALLAVGHGMDGGCLSKTGGQYYRRWTVIEE